MLFAARKILIAFLIPPGCFILVLLVAAALFAIRRRAFAMLFSLLLAATLWLVSVKPVSLRLLGSLEEDFPIPSEVRGDVIVLLGGGVNWGAEDLTGIGIPGSDSLIRTVTAVRLQKRLQVPVIVSGGSGYPPLPPEAPIIGRFLTDLGVPREQVLLEQQSRDTDENARFTVELLRRHGFRKPVLITSAYHLRRAVAMFDRVGVKVTPFPAYTNRPVRSSVWSDWLPSATSMNRTATALRERLGQLWWRL